MDSALWSAFKLSGEPLFWLYERELLKREKASEKKSEGIDPQA